MKELAAFDPITRKIILNPFQYFYELKNSSVDDVVSRLMKNFSFNIKRADFYEEVLAHVSVNQNLDELLNKIKTKEKKYVKDLLVILKKLTNQGLIQSNYKLEYDGHKNIADIKMISLKITLEGRKALRENTSNKCEDLDVIINNFVHKTKVYVEQTDIISCTKETLIENYAMILRATPAKDLIIFERPSKENITIDEFTGRLLVVNMYTFYEFISKESNHALENALKAMLYDTIRQVTDLKIILNLLMMGNLNPIKIFMSEGQFLAYLVHMATEAYLKIDFSYRPKKDKGTHNIRIKKVIITDKGKEYFNNNSLIKLNAQLKLSNVLVISLKELAKKNYKKFNDSKSLKNLMTSEYIH